MGGGMARHSQHWYTRMEEVIMESTDGMRAWQVLSRRPVVSSNGAGLYGLARTKDGRFLKFLWECYSWDTNAHPGEILLVSSDDGKTRQKQPPLHDPEFASYAHRLRTLRDGTLVLALPLAPMWGHSAEAPMRTAVDLKADTGCQMTLTFSYDQGRTWTTPLPIYGGQSVSETDFVELPAGDLLCINNSIFAHPGRQIIRRTAQGWVPRPFEKSWSRVVPETIALTEDGLLVGCLRTATYLCSDDLGLTWFPLSGIPEEVKKNHEVYQPWIVYLGDGRFACAGHNGGDNYFRELDQHIMIHFFKVEHLRRTKNTRLELSRAFDSSRSRWLNSYALKLTCDGEPLPDKDLEFWFVERDKPGYDAFGKYTLAERLGMGGEIVRAQTGADGVAHVNLSKLDGVTYMHHTIQIVVRFNVNRQDPAYKPVQTPQYEFYTVAEYCDRHCTADNYRKAAAR